MRILFLLSALFSIACSAVYRPDLTPSEPIKTRNLIIFYDPTEISTDKLVSISKDKGTELLYQYHNFNAIAVHVPESLNYEKMKSEFSQLKGITGVEEDQIMQIQSTH